MSNESFTQSRKGAKTQKRKKLQSAKKEVAIKNKYYD